MSSSLDFSSVNLSSLAKESKNQLSELCHKLNLLDNFLIQVVLLTVMVHQIAIIYNAERAIDIASITNKCSSTQRNDITAQCNLSIMSARIGFGFTALMLLIVRALDGIALKTASIIQIIFGVIYLVTFIIPLAAASVARGKANECVSAQPSGQIGDPLQELKDSLGYIVNWSAVGMTASLLYVIFYSVRAFTGSSHSAGQMVEEYQKSNASSAASSAVSTPTSA
jgi:hypothetical protein